MTGKQTVNDSVISGQEETEALAKTLEDCVRERIEYMRDEANQMEAALMRVPLAVRKITRLQGQQLGVYF